MKKCKVVNLVIYVILLLVLSGCQKNPPQSEIKPKDKAPESIGKLTTGIDGLLTLVGDIEKIKMDIPLQQKEEEKKSQEQGDEDQSTQGQMGGIQKGQGGNQDPGQ